MKKWLKRAGLAIGSLLLLVALSASLIYLPPIQRWAVDKASAYASEQTGMQVSFEKVRLRFPLKLSLQGVNVQSKEKGVAPYFLIDEVVADVQLLPLFRKKIEIDQLDINNTRFDTNGLIDNTQVSGQFQSLSLQSHGIHLNQETLRLNNALLKNADIHVQLSDTAAVDTTKSHNKWKIDVDQLHIENNHVTVALADNDTHIDAQVPQLDVLQGQFDLGTSNYNIAKTLLKNASVKIDSKSHPKQKNGFDAHHIHLQQVNADIERFHSQDPKLSAEIKHLSFKEQSGFELTSLKAPLTLDNDHLHLSNAQFTTPHSSLTTDIDIYLNSGEGLQPSLSTHLHGSFGREDLLPFLSAMPAGFKNNFPRQPILVDGEVKGSLDNLTFNDLHVRSNGSFDLLATGTVSHFDNPNQRKADVRFQLKAQNMDWLMQLAPADVRQQVRIPRGLAANGRLRIDGTCYATDIDARQDGGRLNGNIQYCEQRPTYKAHLTANAFPLQKFLPQQKLGPLTGQIDAQGTGLDFLSSRTTLQAKARLKRFRYEGYSLDNTFIDADMKNGWLSANVESENNMATGNAQVRAKVNDKLLNATLLCDFIKVDCKQLGLTDTPFTIGLCGHMDVESDFADYYRAEGSISDIVIRESGHVYKADDVTIDLLTKRHLTRCNIGGSDFHLALQSQEGYQQLLNDVNALSSELKKQIAQHTIQQTTLRQHLPNAHLQFTTGKNNLLMQVARSYGYDAKAIKIDLLSSTEEGINGKITADSLIADGFQLDEVQLNFESDQQHINYAMRVENYKTNPQVAFTGNIKGALLDGETHLVAEIYDADHQLGVRLGLNGAMAENGLRITPYGDDPILGYKLFHIGQDNFVFLGNDQRISADVLLRADDGTGVAIYSTDDNTDALQDLTVSLNRFDLEKVLSVIPYAPHVAGQLNGDFHIIQTEQELSIASAVDCRNLIYEQVPMGNLSSEFIYIPKGDGSHYVDGTLFRDQQEICTLTGTYQPAGDGYLDAEMKLSDMPMAMLNGFIENQVLGFEGLANGTMSVIGTLNRPKVDGTLLLDSAAIFSEPYGMRLRFEETPIKVENSHIVLDHFKLYGYNESPLSMTGSIDFSDMAHMKMDMRLMARDFMLINAKETARSEAFGKAFVNIFATLRGELSELQMRGKLDVLGATDLTYILRDSPLTTDNQLDELVKFVNLSDTTQHVVNRPALSGFNMDMSIGIDETAHIVCALNDEQSNYVDIFGGGNLRMRYNNIDHLQLTGRYTLNSGEMKYSLPIIPLRTFQIKDGSYIEFQGDPMNPHLNITATERKKANVSDTGTGSRSVEFECGVVITKTLNDMGLEFIIDAPDDMTISNQLATMGAEERGKIAVTMLTTGMYLADGNTSAFSMNAALSSFLQSQINTIAGNALRTVDFSFGVDNTTNASGGLQTDYSFKFAKRFWNNRLNIQVGGKLSTGSDVQNQNQNFFDNVIFEYRLNNAASKYVKLFYKRNSYDWLEGDVGEYGAGFVWKRKVDHFQDLFRFKEKPVLPPMRQPKDTVTTDSIKLQPHEE